MQLPITRYAVSFQAKQDMNLPYYAGSTLRGIFGHALKAMACLSAKSASDACRCKPQDNCLYRQLFDPIQNRNQDLPPPFLIEADGLPKRLEAGQTAIFCMVLFGQLAHDEEMMIRLAWRRALDSGFDYHGQKIGVKLLNLEVISQPTVSEHDSSTITLQIQTPLRIKQDGKILGVENFCAKAFCDSLLRRYQLIARCHGNIHDMNQHWQTAKESIAHIESSHTLQRQAWARYSNRQHQKINQDGLVGTLMLKNISPELVYYLYLGQWLHVGKGAVFGLGQYRIL